MMQLTGKQPQSSQVWAQNLDAIAQFGKTIFPLAEKNVDQALTKPN